MSIRVLWFSLTPGNYAASAMFYNGGGWIGALENLVAQQPDIELGIAFENKDSLPVKRGNVTYFPINLFEHKKNKLKRLLHPENEEKLLRPEMLRIISQFQPDVIQVFGSETVWGTIADDTDIPVVIHLQGLLSAYIYAKYPPGFGHVDFLRGAGFHLKRLYQFITFNRIFHARVEREKRILRTANYFMGRTHWDHEIIKLYHPDAQYFYCSEMLRPEFYVHAQQWRRAERPTVKLVSIISTPAYKGQDLILKTARLLKDLGKSNFIWSVFGVPSLEIFEKHLKIKAEEVNVKLCGTASAEKVCRELLDCSLYIHPSYIENSPNSVCEAQLLGVPIVATNVGGVASLIEDGEDGFLVPANDPHMLVARMIRLLECPELAERVGAAAGASALKRHAPSALMDSLKNIYSQLSARKQGYDV